MKGLIVDTGVFYALLDADDSYYKQAQAELNQVIEQKLKLYTSFPVLLESLGDDKQAVMLVQQSFWMSKMLKETEH